MMSEQDRCGVAMRRANDLSLTGCDLWLCMLPIAAFLSIVVFV